MTVRSNSVEHRGQGTDAIDLNHVRAELGGVGIAALDDAVAEAPKGLGEPAPRRVLHQREAVVAAAGLLQWFGLDVALGGHGLDGALAWTAARADGMRPVVSANYSQSRPRKPSISMS
jgi:hypothetical protein